ncbi:MAG: phosphotransferase [Dehalococcoidia bacterium]
MRSVEQIDPAEAEQVAATLLRYLRATAGGHDVSYSERPQLLADGTDTFVYGFRIEGMEAGPPWAAPLVVRVFRRGEDAGRAEREASVQRFAADRGYRTPAVLAFEREGAGLGLPFAIMGRAPGVHLLKRFEQNPLRVLRLVRTMAEAHAALHRLPVEGCPVEADGPLVERRLAALAGWMEQHELSEPRGAYDWLVAHKGAVADEERRLCHNDFHPLNIIVGDDGGWVVIDWSRAEVGDRLHDVARTHVVMSLAQGGGRNLGERALLQISRFVAGRYLAAYGRLLPVDRHRLRYWQALLTFQSWVETAPMMEKGAEAVGARAGAASGYRRDIVAKIKIEFWRHAARFESGS